LAPGFYAQQDIRTPVRIAVITLVATQTMNLVLIWPLQHVGLALAIALGACLNATLLYRTLRRRGIYTPRPGWLAFLTKMFISLCTMAVVLWFAAGESNLWLATGPAERAARLAGVVVLGAATYFVALLALRFRMRDFLKRV
jgi:putative peptidoglycan lipid II flippase